MPGKWSKWQRWTGVKCPHCGLAHDLSPFDYVLIPMKGIKKKEGKDIPVFTCELMKDGTDLGCGKQFEVVQVDQPVLVRVREAAERAAGFDHIQTDEERLAFEQSKIWKEMQKKNPRT